LTKRIRFIPLELKYQKIKFMNMQALHIEPTDDTPKIYFEPDLEIYEIEGKSLPEDAKGFYQPVFDWASQVFHSENPPQSFVLNFKLEYFNTASSKQIAKLFRILETSPISDNITIKWYHDKDDSDMLKAGTRYSNLIKLKFDFVISND
jgi:hypothetical protein